MKTNVKINENGVVKKVRYEELNIGDYFIYGDDLYIIMDVFSSFNLTFNKLITINSCTLIIPVKEISITYTV